MCRMQWNSGEERLLLSASAISVVNCKFAIHFDPPLAFGPKVFFLWGNFYYLKKRKKLLKIALRALELFSIAYYKTNPQLETKKRKEKGRCKMVIYCWCKGIKCHIAQESRSMTPNESQTGKPFNSYRSRRLRTMICRYLI